MDMFANILNFNIRRQRSQNKMKKKNSKCESHFAIDIHQIVRLNLHYLHWGKKFIVYVHSRESLKKRLVASCVHCANVLNEVFFNE